MNVKHGVSKVIKLAEALIKGYGRINYKGKGKINVIDVGSIGSLPAPWYQHSRKIKNLLKFEPQDKSSAHKNVITIDKALWSEKGTRPFYIYKGFNSTGSSLFEQNFDYVNENFEELRKIGSKHLVETWHDRSTLIRTVNIECITLDNVLNEMSPKITFDFLKVDAQGAEYEILMGAKDFLKNECIGLHLELFNKPLYKGMKLFEDVASYLEDFEFILYKKIGPNGSFDSQYDCIFIRNPGLESKNHLIDLLKEVYK